MAKALIIVESPAKIKTLKKILGPSFIFESSYGHIRDLPQKEFGVDIENDFEPTYTTLPDKKEVISKLKKAAQECDVVYLAPDPDREGEAIAWHIAEILPKSTKIERITFHSITKSAVEEAVNNPSTINHSLVNAQQARRILDRLVGYSISPLLNRRLKRSKTKSVSAGRVQSAALKLVVDRERAILAFTTTEYWTIRANLLAESGEFSATLFAINGVRIEKTAIEGKEEGKDFVLVGDEKSALLIEKELKEIKESLITKVERKERRRNPEPPFITSTLQQEASRHFYFQPAKTMQIAQELYEGIDLGSEGTEGLITYMRTDSIRTAKDGIDEVREYIQKEFGKKSLPDTPREFQAKKSAQDAHEAIRPTSVFRDPDSIKEYLTPEQYKLYSLIWKRFVASQMLPAIYDTVSVTLEAGKYLLRATGSQLKFSGFLAVYEEKKDEEEIQDKDRLLPDLEEGKKASIEKILKEQSFTKPPPRFSEATLIKELEKSGIGRPSTYATIMKKIQSRDYTTKENRKLKPTELGCVITEMLEENFNPIVATTFTALMENDLEDVAEDKKAWKGVIRDFWKEFSPLLQHAEEHAHVPKVTTDIPCPQCGAFLQKVWSPAQSKYFLGCENYPECSYTTSFEEMQFDKSAYAKDFNWEQPCPKCSAPMKVRFGKFGPFLGCTNYPECKGIVNIPKEGEEQLEQEEVPCPATGCTGHLVQRRSRFGKPFFSCSEYPLCDVIGNSIDAVQEKYTGREKTAYVKKTPVKKTATKKAPVKKTTTKKKEETEKKPAPKKRVTKKKTTEET